MPAPFPQDIQLGKVHAEPGAGGSPPRSFPVSGYQITPKDVFFLVVASAFEESRAPVYPCWLMIQRYVFKYPTFSQYGGLWALVERFSQPVNPIWAYPEIADQRQIRLAINNWTRVGRVPSPNARLSNGRPDPLFVDRVNARIDNINKIQGMLNGDRSIWNSLSSRSRDTVLSVCLGMLDSPVKGLDDFAAPFIVRNNLEMRAGLSLEEISTHLSTRVDGRIGGVILTRGANGSLGNSYVRDSSIEHPDVFIIGPNGQDSRRATNHPLVAEGTQTFSISGNLIQGTVSRNTFSQVTATRGVTAGSGDDQTDLVFQSAALTPEEARQELLEWQERTVRTLNSSIGHAQWGSRQ